MPPPGPFSPLLLLRPHFQPPPSPLPPAGSHLNACRPVRRREAPSPTGPPQSALTTGRSGLDLLKDPGGGACPSLAAWLTDGVGFRPVALERERQRAKSWSPPPPGSPRRVSPPPPGPARVAQGPLGRVGRAGESRDAEGVLAAERSRPPGPAAEGAPGDILCPPPCALPTQPTQRPGCGAERSASPG